jgi:hypothetical protein
MNLEGITGRDGYIMMKALAYAIEAIESLPMRWQEVNDKDDMKLLLDAYAGSNLSGTNRVNYHRTEARKHLTEQEAVNELA